MKVILVDDEKLSLQSLANDLNHYCPELQIVAAENNPVQAITAINTLQPDIVISDIQMPEMNAFTMLDQLTWKNFSLIFSTAYSKYAIRAFEFSAVDYLLKPISKDKLIQAVKKARVAKENLQVGEKLKMVIHNLKFINQEHYTLAVPTTDGAEFIDVSQIIRVQAAANYCIIELKNNERIVVSKPLKHFDGILSSHNFIRVHQSHLVNGKEIRSYRKGKGGSLILKDESIIPISKNYKENLMLYLFNEEQ